MSTVSKGAKVNGRKRPSRSSRSIRTYVTKSEIHGGRFTPSSNPPDVTYQPWHPVTLIFSFEGEKEIKVPDVPDQLRAQLDPTKRGFNANTKGDDRFIVQFRLLSVQAWNLTGRVIALSAEDFVDHEAASGGRDQLCGLVDTGTSIHTPAVGFRFPANVSNHVIRNDDKFKDTYLININGGTGDRIISYVKILYRFDGPVKIPSILDPVGSIARSSLNVEKINRAIKTDSTELIRTLKRVNVTLDQLQKEKPSTTSKVIDGVSKLALLVQAVADDSTFPFPGQPSACSSEFDDCSLPDEAISDSLLKTE